MFLKRARIENFRAIRDITVEFNNQTAILGANGVGKSSILRGINLFYNQSTNVELDDFFGRDPSQQIRIALTFTSFSETEQERFSSRIHRDEMTVVRVFDATAGRQSGRYYGSALQHSAFAAIRAAGQAVPRRSAYNSLREQGGIYAELKAVTRAEDIEPELAEWELRHPDICELALDDGQFFGFTNVARGALQKATNFVFIPAVRDASADASDARGAAIARLMELVVRNAILQRHEVKTWQARIAEEYRQITDPEKLKELVELSGELTETLRLFYGESAVNLRWQQAQDFSLPLPGAEVLLDEDGFEGPVDRKGHGLQRAFVLTLLQHLAKAATTDESRREAAAARQATNPPEQPGNGAQETMAQLALPGLILAIEEPELYQHPTKQRHFAKVLGHLGDGRLPGVATRTQVIYASHSPLFVSMERFHEVRLARRCRVPDSAHKECTVTWATLADVSRRLERAFDKKPGLYTEESLLPRLHIINAEIAEGFFSDCVVLVEGPSDRAALIATGQIASVDFEALGIAVLAVDGKCNIDRPAAIFMSLGIPVYAMWDCDKCNSDQKIEHNRALQRLFTGPDDVVEDFSTKIAESFSCFEDKLETTLRSEIGELYEFELDRIKNIYGITRKEAQKSPAVMLKVLAGTASQGGRSATLDSILRSIVALRNRGGY